MTRTNHRLPSNGGSGLVMTWNLAEASADAAGCVLATLHREPLGAFCLQEVGDDLRAALEGDTGTWGSRLVFRFSPPDGGFRDRCSLCIGVDPHGLLTPWMGSTPVLTHIVGYEQAVPEAMLLTCGAEGGRWALVNASPATVESESRLAATLAAECATADLVLLTGGLVRRPRVAHRDDHRYRSSRVPPASLASPLGAVLGVVPSSPVRPIRAASCRTSRKN
ncbi:MAG: hypothetical protein GY842_17370 [bacterium]|nr:hypothetical protein [bacterium]